MQPGTLLKMTNKEWDKAHGAAFAEWQRGRRGAPGGGGGQARGGRLSR